MKNSSGIFFRYIVLFGISILVSCKKDVSEIKIQNPPKFSEVFDEFWIGMDQNYMYWDIDTTNWNAIYSTYKPYFQKLDMKNKHDVKKSVQYFREMTKGLIDGHYSISFVPDAIKDSIVYPSYERKERLSGFHYPFSYFKIDTNYLDKDFILGFNNAFSNAGVPLSALSGTINHKILYFGCNSFALSKSYFDQTQNGVKPVLQYFFDSLKDLSGNIKAVIIDVRSNAGGDLNDLNFLIGRFIDKPLHFGYVQYKTGNGRLDFTPWMNAVINPVSNSTAISVSVVVLADNVSASLSEAVVMAIQTLPNGVFIGERTWGATGPVASEDTYNAGSFTVNGFLSVQSSSCRFKYLNGKSYEGKGYPPDIQVQFKLNDLNNGKDAALEKAIDYINSKIN